MRISGNCNFDFYPPMRRILTSLLLLSLLIACQRQPPDEVKLAIQRELNKVEGEFAVAFLDLTTGEQILINEHTLFHAASTMKVPVMIEIFKQANGSKFLLTDSIEIKNEFKSIVDSSVYSLHREDDSDTLIYEHIGEKRTVYSLMYDMIIISSNLATNMMIDLVGATNAQQTMRDLGTKKMQVLRGVEDSKAYEAGLNNSTTAYDLMVIFEKMAKGEVVDSTASAEMIKILLDQKFNDIIPAELPSDLKVAHKTGWITGVHHDGGIVFLPDGRKYILVLLSKNLKDEKAGVAVMSNISKLIYNWVR
jgi:beta-lactamase class A